MKYLLAVLALLALAAGAFAKIEHGRAVDATEKAATAQEARRNTEAALSRANEMAGALRTASLARQQELNRLRKQAEVQKKALNDALQANPDWARTPVPGSVWDAIAGPQAGASEARPRVDRADARAAADRTR